VEVAANRWPLEVERDGANGALFMAAMMFGGVLILLAPGPGFALGGTDEVFGIAELQPVLRGKTPRALGDEHHVIRVLHDFACQTDGILDSLQASGGSSAERGGVHDYGVAFHAAVQIQVRAVTGVEDRIVLKNDDGSFDGI